MLRCLALLTIGLGSVVAAHAASRSYTVTIDGVATEINLGETIDVTLKDNRKVAVSITRNPFDEWSDEALSFSYPSTLSVASQKLDKKITQHLLATAVGTVIIVQEYDGLDPSSLKQLMMTELTKNDVKAGAQLSQSNATKKLAGGTELNGLTGQLKTRNDTKNVEVYSYGNDGRGVLLITMISDEHRDTDKTLIDRFWESLALKF